MRSPHEQGPSRMARPACLALTPPTPPALSPGHRGRLDRYLVRQPATGLGTRLLRPRRHPALAPRPDHPPGRPRQPGGEQVRIEISNEYGDLPMTVGAATSPRPASRRRHRPRIKPLTFGGETSATIPPGALIWSDPADLSVAALDTLSVSLYLPENHADHDLAQRWPADRLHRRGRPDHRGELRARHHHQFAHLPQRHSRRRKARCTFDRALRRFDHRRRQLDPNENKRWPDILAERIVATGADVSLLNEGISGARVLRDRMGTNALARFDEDVLSHPRADTVVVMMGINDIGWPDSLLPRKASPPPCQRHHRRLQAADRARPRP